MQTTNHRAQRVLVVVRNSAERHRLVRDLSNAGYAVEAKDSCSDAATYCRQSLALHGLVVETELPWMWGVELARSASQYHPHLAIVCVCNGEPKSHVKHEVAERGWSWINSRSPSYASAIVEKLRNSLVTTAAN